MGSKFSRRQVLAGAASAAVVAPLASPASAALLPSVTGAGAKRFRVLRAYRIYEFRPLTVWVKVRMGMFGTTIHSVSHPALLALRDVPDYGAVELLVTGPSHRMTVVAAIARPDIKNGWDWVYEETQNHARKELS